MSCEKTNEVTATITQLTRRRSSANGNPAWRIMLDGGAVLDTEPDVSVSYELGNPEFRDTAVRFDLNKYGRVIYAKPIS